MSSTGSTAANAATSAHDYSTLFAGMRQNPRRASRSASPPPSPAADSGEEASVRLVFLDDSIQTDPRRAGLGELVAVGAVLVPDTSVKPYAAALAALRTDLGVPYGEEIKWKAPKNTFLAGAG